MEGEARQAASRSFSEGWRPAPPNRRAFRVGFVAGATKTAGALMPSALQFAVIIIEYAMALCGLAYLGWLCLSERGRALRARPVALKAWNVTVFDFLVLGWFVLSVGFVGQLLLRAVAGPLPNTGSDKQTFELLLYGVMFHFGAILSLPASRALSRWRGADVPQIPMPAAPASLPREFRGSFLTFLVVMPLVGGASLVWERLLQTLGLPTERQELVDLFLHAKSPALLVFLVVLALVVAPFSEELIFRAGIFRFLRSHGPRWVAFVVSAGLFALLHANWFSSLPLFILGLVFAAAYERTGRIAVPMLAHALFNLNTLLLVLSGVGG
jgi:membrane protease YdiL (CAAX protease family)